MTITRHPTDETLLRYAAGTLPEGPTLVVAVHVALCGACQRQIRTCEALGGALIESLPPATLSADALAVTLARLDSLVLHGGNRDAASAVAAATTAERLVARTRPALPAGLAWPEVLQPYDIGRWRFLAPGVKWSAVDLRPKGERSRDLNGTGIERPDPGRLIAVWSAPGVTLPSHGHDGTEYTFVLAGSFSDATGHYGPGDVSEADADLDHQPIAGADEECICLIAVEGRLRLRGFLGRLFQPFLGV